MHPKWHNGGGVSFAVPAARFDDTPGWIRMRVVLSSRFLCHDPSGLPVRTGTMFDNNLSLISDRAWLSGLIVDDETYDPLHIAIRLE